MLDNTSKCAVHKSWPSINQFRQVVREVKSCGGFKGIGNDGTPIIDQFAAMPTLKFEGTVKLHGSNASVVCETDKYDNFWAQSRERVLSQLSDNFGFAQYCYEHQSAFTALLTEAHRHYVDNDITHYSVFGEWCGGNVQKGVALSQVPKIFGIIAWTGETDANGNFTDVARRYFTREKVIAVVNDAKQRVLFPTNIYTAYDFPTYSLEIDFNQPEVSQNQLGDITVAVEQECPVGKQLGATGTGEGVVWKCVTPGFEESRFMFKVKGEKHSSSKVKTLASVDIEVVNSINELADTVVTESRLIQGLEYLRSNGLTIEPKNTPVFLKWISDDVVKEETDTIIGSGLQFKDVVVRIKFLARTWFLAHEED